MADTDILLVDTDADFRFGNPLRHCPRNVSDHEKTLSSDDSDWALRKSNKKKPLVDDSASRVVIRDSGFLMQLCDYDHTVYEEQMFHFNTRQRTALYHHDVVGEGLDHCYDCRAEIHILTEYSQNVLGMPCANKDDRLTIATHVGQLSKSISRSITHRRTLLDGNSDPSVRMLGIQKTQRLSEKLAYKVAHEIRRCDLISRQDSIPLLDKCDYGSRTAYGRARRVVSANITQRNPVLDTRWCFPVCVRKLSDTTIDHPLTNGMRLLLQRAPTVFELPKDLKFEQQQKPPSTTGWARCVSPVGLPKGTVLYVHKGKNVYTQDAPAINGWVVRAGELSTVSNDEVFRECHKPVRFYYEDTLSGTVTLFVPDPMPKVKIARPRLMLYTD